MYYKISSIYQYYQFYLNIILCLKHSFNKINSDKHLQNLSTFITLDWGGIQNLNMNSPFTLSQNKDSEWGGGAKTPIFSTF